MGKSIDKRLSELGAIRKLELCCADEATGLEESVEGWKKTIFPILLTMARERSNSVVNQVEQNSGCTNVSIKQNSIVDTAEIIPFMSCIPEGLTPLNKVAELLGVLDDINKPVEDSMVPRVPANTKDSFSYTGSDIDYQYQSCSSESGFTAQNPFVASIVRARQLTTPEDASTAGEISWEEIRKVISIDISLASYGMHFQPGDSIGICCPNPPYAVNAVLSVLKRAHPDTAISLQSGIRLKSNEVLSLGELLSYRYDLVGTPKRNIMAGLAAYCSDPVEMNTMRLLSSKHPSAKKLWSQFVEAQKLGVAEIIFLFPSCKPTVSQLFSLLVPMPPRLYSIASSPLKKSDVVSIALSIVHSASRLALEPVDNQPIIRRKGVCTGYLEDLYESWAALKASASPESEYKYRLRVFLKPSLHFHLPGSVQHPLLLIGPGTGVSPFIGFLEHRSHIEKERKKRGGEIISTGVWRGGFELDDTDLPCECNSVENYIHSVLPGHITLYFG